MNPHPSDTIRQSLAATSFADLAAILNRVYEGYTVPLSFDEASTRRYVKVHDVVRAASFATYANRELTAAALLAIRGRRGWLGAFGVAPAFRGTGRARCLIAAISSEARRRGLRSVQLEVLADNEAAIATYGGAGFVENRRLISYDSPELCKAALSDHSPVDVNAILALPSAFRPSWQNENRSARAMRTLDAVRVGKSNLVYFRSGKSLRILRANFTGAGEIKHLVERAAAATGATTAKFINVPEGCDVEIALRHAGWLKAHVQYEMTFDVRERAGGIDLCWSGRCSRDPCRSRKQHRMKSRSKPATESPYRPLPVNSYGGLSAKDRQEQRRERLIEAATELFGSVGYASTTIQKICDTAGCALRTFYEEFGSREVLLKLVYERIVERLLDTTFDAVREAGQNAGDVIRAGTRAYVGAITADAKQARIMLIESLGVSPDLDASRREAQASFVKRIGLATGQMQLSFGSDDFESMSLALIGAADMLATAWVISRGRMSPKRMSETLITVWTRSLRVD